MIRALVFDFDGLILDTESIDFRTWQETFEQHGVTLSLEAWAHSIGAPAGVFNTAAHLEELLGRKLDRDSLKKARRKRFYDILATEQPRPGVEDYLKQAKRLGLKLAVASSANRDWVLSHLMRLGLLNYFECYRNVEDVAHGKPAPDLYLAAARALGVKPEHAIAFEDSPNGVLAAKRAGLHCVAVPNHVTRHLSLSHADLVIESFDSLPLDELIHTIEDRSSHAAPRRRIEVESSH